MTDRTEQPAFWAEPEVRYIGAEESLAHLEEVWSAGCFDGILGFSQGGTAAALLAARLERRGCANLPRFVIVCAGFRTPLPTNSELDWWRAAAVGPEGAPLATPALFVVGERDVVTPPSQTRQLAALFADATVHEVRGGQHAMPQQAADLTAVRGFLERIRASTPASGPARAAL